jgi:hypothetical protein
MALSSVSLTLKQKIFDEKTDMLLIYGVWKEFCRRCRCLEADGRHTFYINLIC